MAPEYFFKLVSEIFVFLERDYGFSTPSMQDYRVRFDSPEVFVTVVYDAHRSYELGMQIGLQKNIKHNVERPFEIWEILRVLGYGSLPEAKSTLQSSPNNLKESLQRLAYLAQSYAFSLLKGNRNIFHSLDVQRDADCEAYALEKRLFYARQDAEEAWQKQQFDKFIELLIPFKKYLSPAEHKKLHIAGRRVSGERQSEGK